MTEQDLPPLVQGDVWERRLSRVAARAKEFLSETAASPSAGVISSIGNMPAAHLEKLITSAISLALAGQRDNVTRTPDQLSEDAKNVAGQVLQGARATQHVGAEPANAWKRQVLWVDDKPSNNAQERRAMEAVGIQFTLATSTNEALKMLQERRFAAVVSDMGRKEGRQEGFVLLEAIRATDKATPFFIYTSTNAISHRASAEKRGANGTTAHATELFDWVARAINAASDGTERRSSTPGQPFDVKAN